MPVHDAREASSDEMLCDIACGMENCGTLIKIAIHSVARGIPVPMKIDAEGGAAALPAWKGVGAALGRERSWTRT